MSTAPAAGSGSQEIEGAQDFKWGGGEGSSSESMSPKRYRLLNDLMQRGNAAFREYRLEQAMDSYTRANNIKPNDPMILGNRSAAYLQMGSLILSRPPSASEQRPLRGLDPTSYAGLALKDAEKLMSLQSNSERSYILKANALVLLERYDLARDAIFSGLQVNPQSAPLLNLERAIPHTLMRRNREIPLRADDYDCPLCMKLLYEPITTPCGHTFCRSCLFQTMDRGNKCPLCRKVLFVSPKTCSISVTLNNIIQKNFPEKYAERKSENDSLTNFGADRLPLLVEDILLPCQRLQLLIDEPRYRLMARRIMEGNRRMGMTVMCSGTNSVEDYACEVEITDCEPLPKGGFLLEVECRRRCRIVRHWNQDGYLLAEVEWVQDVLPPEGTAERNDLLSTTERVANFACNWLEWAKEVEKGDETTLEELYEAEELMPPRNDPERFSFWLCTLTNHSPSEILSLLRMTDTKERMRIGLFYLRLADQSLPRNQPRCKQTHLSFQI